MPEQLSLGFLGDTFQVAARKTLKTAVKKNADLGVAVKNAHEYLQGNREGYTSIEFKFGNCYIVVARLKEERSEPKS